MTLRVDPVVGPRRVELVEAAELAGARLRCALWLTGGKTVNVDRLAEQLADDHVPDRPLRE